VNIALPDIQKTFSNARFETLSWVLNAYTIIFSALLVPAGKLGDQLGRRKIFVSGLILFVIASLLCSIAPSLAMLIAARVVQGAGAALMIPTSLALLLPEYSHSERSTAVGLWAASAAVAGGLGPSLGGFLVEYADWRWIFLINVPIGGLAAVMALRKIPESRDLSSKGLPDLLGSLLVAVTVGLVALGLIEGQDWGWSSIEILGSFAGALLFGSLFVYRSNNHPLPVIDMNLMRVRQFALGNLASLLFALAFYSWLLCNVLFLDRVWEYSTLHAGLALTPSPLLAMIFAAISGRIADRRGHRGLVVVGVLLFVAGVLWLIVDAEPTSHYVTAWLPGAVLSGIGVGLAFPVMGSFAVSVLPFERFAVGSAINSTARQLGAVLGVAALVSTLEHYISIDPLAAFDYGWMIAVVSAAASGVVGFFFTQSREKNQTV